MKKLAILDDYQNVAMDMANWSPLAGDVEITVFNDHLADEDAVAERLKDFEIIMVMRERTPFPRSLFEKLPKLEHLVSSGMRNLSVDVDAAELGDSSDVDQQGRARHSHRHQRHQRLAAGDDPRVLSGLGQRPAGFVDRRGAHIIERGGFHLKSGCLVPPDGS